MARKGKKHPDPATSSSYPRKVPSNHAESPDRNLSASLNSLSRHSGKQYAIKSQNNTHSNQCKATETPRLLASDAKKVIPHTQTCQNASKSRSSMGASDDPFTTTTAKNKNNNANRNKTKIKAKRWLWKYQKPNISVFSSLSDKLVASKRPQSVRIIEAKTPSFPSSTTCSEESSKNPAILSSKTSKNSEKNSTAGHAPSLWQELKPKDHLKVEQDEDMVEENAVAESWYNFQHFFRFPNTEGCVPSMPQPRFFCANPNTDNVAKLNAAHTFGAVQWSSPTGSSVITDLTTSCQGVQNMQLVPLRSSFSHCVNGPEKAAIPLSLCNSIRKRADGSTAHVNNLDAAIEMDTLHFSGWDGYRSHYTATVAAAKENNNENDSTNDDNDDKLDNVLICSPHKKRTLSFFETGSSTCGNIKKENSPPPNITLTEVRSSLLSPKSHPLTNHTNDTTGIISKSSPPILSVIHVVPQSPTATDASKTYRHKTHSSSSGVSALSYGVVEDACADVCDILSLISSTKNGSMDTNWRKRFHQSNKDNVSTGGDMESTISGKRSALTPMGDEERGMILNFLASSSSSGGSENCNDEAYSSNDEHDSVCTRKYFDNEIEGKDTHSNIKKNDIRSPSSPSFSANILKKYASPVGAILSGLGGRPPRINKNRHHALALSSEKKNSTKKVSHWRQDKDGSCDDYDVSSYVSSNSASMSSPHTANSKSSKHRRTNGATSETIFFSPCNGDSQVLGGDQETQREEHQVKGAVRYSSQLLKSQESGQLTPGKNDLLTHSGNKQLPDTQKSQDHNEKGNKNVTPTDIICDSRDEEELSPMMLDEYSPAVMYEKSRNRQSDFEIHKHQEKDNTDFHQPSGTFLKQAVKNGIVDKRSGVKDINRCGGLYDRKKLVLPSLYHNESVNVNLFGNESPQKVSNCYSGELDVHKDAKEKLKNDDPRKGTKNSKANGQKNNLPLAFLLKCSPSIRLDEKKGKRGEISKKRVFEGWMALLTGEDAIDRCKKIGREDLRYVVLFEDSPFLHTIVVPGNVSTIEKADLSQEGLIVFPALVSKKLGHCVAVKHDRTNQILFTLLPINVDPSFFEKDDCSHLVRSEIFDKLYKAKISTRRKQFRKSHWGDPAYMLKFASTAQHEVALHIMYAINATIYKFSDWRLRVTTKDTVNRKTN